MPRRCALGRAVQLGEHDAGGAGGLSKLPRLLQSILAGGGVHHQQDLVGRAGNQFCSGAAHLVQLVHEAGFGVEATGGIHNQLVDVVRFGGGDCVIKHRSRSPPWRVLIISTPERVAQTSAARCRGAEGVGGAEENGAILCAMPGGQLAGGCGLAGAVDANEESDVRAV